jgi:hypothetical protein
LVGRCGEDNRDRVGLREHDQAICIRRVYHVPDVDLTKSDPAREGCGDAGKLQLQARVCDLRLIRADRAFQLPHHVELGVDDLLRDGVLGAQTRVALQIDLGVRELRLIVCQLAAGLIERDLVGARIDSRQQITALDQLSFMKGNRYQGAVHPAANGNGVHRSHGSQGIDGTVNTTRGSCNRTHGDRATGIPATPGLGVDGRVMLDQGEHADASQQGHSRSDQHLVTGVGSIALFVFLRDR